MVGNTWHDGSGLDVNKIGQDQVQQIVPTSRPSNTLRESKLNTCVLKRATFQGRTTRPAKPPLLMHVHVPYDDRADHVLVKVKVKVVPSPEGGRRNARDSQSTHHPDGDAAIASVSPDYFVSKLR